MHYERLAEILALFHGAHSTTHGVTAEHASKMTGIPRPKAIAHIEYLMSCGFPIKVSDDETYHMSASARRLKSELISKHLGESGSNFIHCMEIVDSTNDRAKRLATNKASHGTAVFADFQTSGRGKANRVWISNPYENIAMSVVLRPCLETQHISRITVAASVAIVRSVKRVTNIESQIDRPNDLLIGGLKFCGILPESRIAGDAVDYVVLGIGINVNQRNFPTHLRHTATSLALSAGRDFKREELCAQILSELELTLSSASSDDFHLLKSEYEQFCVV